MYNSGEFVRSNESVKSFLSENGYNVTDHGDYLKCNALFRGGADENSVTIYIRDSLVIDHVSAEKYSLKKFFSKVLNTEESKIDDELKSRNIVLNNFNPAPKIHQPRTFSSDILKELLPIYDFWIKRGISEEVLRETKGGIYNHPKGIFRGKFVFPVINGKNQITMLAGREIVNKDTNWRWILRGAKDTVYPLFINSKDIIKNKEIILTEGIPDVLTFMTCGIRTSVCMFGTECGLPIINFLLKLQDIRIIIATNNDKAGLNSADKSYKRLSKYFDKKNIRIKLPPEGFKDFNDLMITKGKESILGWYKD